MISPRTKTGLYVRPCDQIRSRARRVPPLSVARIYWKAESGTLKNTWPSAMVHSNRWSSLGSDTLTYFLPVPLPPTSITDRLKFLEDHIIQLERDFPPWAALHLNQPNREVFADIGYFSCMIAYERLLSGHHHLFKHRLSSLLVCLQHQIPLWCLLHQRTLRPENKHARSLVYERLSLKGWRFSKP